VTDQAFVFIQATATCIIHNQECLSPRVLLEFTHKITYGGEGSLFYGVGRVAGRDLKVNDLIVSGITKGLLKYRC
jgi:hypothetical protein